ncbi:Protein translocase subunit SecE [Olavius algarvensis Delta 1 endosymbiont]|nr:Protein translocase subunit SecE [Olavius algarvensis Delta 1 endosymbiont]
MGRIQRKKPSGSKKKKKQRSDQQPAGGVKQAQVHGLKKGSAGAAVVKSDKKKQAPGAGPVASKPKDNLLTKTTQFLREVKVELKKVTWPSRKQTIGSTAVVIALVMIISLFLGVVDFGISSLIRIVLQ